MASPPPWESEISFKACTDFMENVSRDSDRQSRLSKLGRFLDQCRRIMKQHNSGHGASPATSTLTASLYPIMRLFLPANDRERGSYGIKEVLLGKIYVDLLKLGPNSSDAMKLKNYRAPKSSSSSSRGDAGDFGAVLFSVIKDRVSPSSDKGYSVGEVNAELDALVTANATEGRRGVERILMGCFRRMTAVQQKWLVRIVLKDVKMGLGQKALMNGLHPDANDLYEVNANLEKVCKILHDPTIRQHEIEVKLFDHFMPMLADRIPIRDVVAKLDNKEFYIEVKYDGERMQLHRDESGTFRFFSRNGNDFSEDFGRSAAQVDKFSHHIAGCLTDQVKSIILDGEICAFNYVTNSLTQKGEQMNIRQLRPDDERYQQCLFVYDVVYLNGRVLTNLPLRDRLHELQKCVVERHGRVHFASRKTARTTAEVVEALNDAIDRREEGLVLKNPDSVYKPNARAKGGWIKVKPEYNDSLMDQFDLVIMGGYYGRGRGGGVVTHFLLGLAVASGNGAATDIDGGESSSNCRNPREFHSFCRVGSGYSDRELSDLLQRLQPHFRDNRNKATTAAADGIKMEFGREKPDVWISPKKSVLLQVKAAEIVASDVYKVGCTLRFPRVEKIRSEDDKPWHKCMSTEEMATLKREGEGKLANRHFNLDDDAGPATKRKKRDGGGGGVSSRAKQATLSSVYRQAVDSASQMVETHDLKDRVIVIEPNDAAMKRRLEAVVLRLGGTCEQNVSRGRTFCYVETGNKIRARNVARSGHCDVVRKEWLLDCDAKFRPFRPSDMLAVASEETKARFARDFDAFGDAFAERATMESMKAAMQSVSETRGEEAVVTAQAMAEFESEYFDRPYKYGLFRQHRIFVDKRTGGVDGIHRLDLVEMTIRFYGGTIMSELSSDVTHVVVDEENSDVGEIKRLRRGREKKFRIVTEKWIEESIEEEKVLTESAYEL